MKRPSRKLTASSSLGVLAAAAAALAGVFFTAAPALAQEPASCLSPNPADWPPSSKPYFMLDADTSGSMATSVAATNSCGYPNDRVGHLRCALRNTILAFSGQVNFGLTTFPMRQQNCGAACFNNCTYSNYPNNNGIAGCGSGSNTTRNGGYIQVPMLQDSFWMLPPPANNTPQLLQWVDNNCTGNIELFAAQNTPLNGILRSTLSYFSAAGWTSQDGLVHYDSPLAMQDLAGSGINGSTGCRSVNTILLTDGDETCDSQANAVTAATALYGTGVTVGGKNYKIRVFVINFAGGSVTNTNQIAAAGGTGSSVLANNEAELSIALANIIQNAIKPEVCDNTDNNCNGCTDEGSPHYCDVAQTCCAWATPAQRTTCLNNYTATISAGDPDGDLTKLPCTTAVQQTQPANWLCYNPGESCDDADNNCNAVVDEGITKCGMPLHCPTSEICGDAVDNDCNGLTDELAQCAGCIPSTEVCDGCDNDCDGLIDETIPSLPCGLPSPPNCTGTQACMPKNNPNGLPGTCVGGGFNQCSYTPGQEVCDNIDNDCDGIIDDGVAAAPCVPPGQPMNLDYGPNSQCKMGSKMCGSNLCIGFVGPSAEVCDGIDNDCDGAVDDNVFGIGLPCGLNQPPCTPGTTACVNGALVCQGGAPPQPEMCDGIDNNCNGVVDDAPLADGPPAGMNGCWNEPAAGCCPGPNCCVFKNLQWCAPPGATCSDPGSLTMPCNNGTLACSGAAWVCQGGKSPAGETCDGIDNDCNGAVDDGMLPQVGTVCGVDTGECKTGVLVCTAGVLDCVGDIPPSQEVCDGIDNDCNGVIDNGVMVGMECTPPYDSMQYPNPPIFAPCFPGSLVCDGSGQAVCTGGQGPNPEVCNAIDDDCDGMIDEAGMPPNGIDGTADPNDPTHIIGEDCGVNVGACTGGKYACVGGAVICQGGDPPQPEECDCKDNDCNGQVDDAMGICSEGKDCVTDGTACLCAEPCNSGEFKCPAGQNCVQVMVNGENKGYCFPEVCPNDCVDATTKDAGSGAVVCAPAGTPPGADCTTPPACVCKNQNGCQNPCFNVTCSGGLVCTDYGPNAGKCVADTCYNVPCAGCDTACHLNSCVDNPCEPNPCAAGEQCNPNADFTGHTCNPSCADVTCPSGQVCVDGACQAGCKGCGADEVCDLSKMPPECVPNKCPDGPTCQDGSCCDPVTGNCGDCACSGVFCPPDQVCKNADGQCHSASAGSGGGGSGGGGNGGGGTGPGTTSGTGASGARGGWGLATGGGGCSCRLAGDDDSSRYALGLGALAVALAAARRRRRDARRA